MSEVQAAGAVAPPAEVELAATLGAPAQNEMTAVDTEAQLSRPSPCQTDEAEPDFNKIVDLEAGPNEDGVVSNAEVLKEGEHMEDEKKGKPKWCLFFASRSCSAPLGWRSRRFPARSTSCCYPSSAAAPVESTRKSSTRLWRGSHMCPGLSRSAFGKNS
ncbi:unnamed protein product [Amoebophrya sp. A120]|nr:unnamed protein product [Amoebophrya sp. A120]|eukprot:GSA120T00010491001.1